MADQYPGARKCVILLNGFQGVGKSTIARALKQHLRQPTAGQQPRDIRLLSYHHIADPAAVVHPNGGTFATVLRTSIRHTVLYALQWEMRDRIREGNDIVVIIAEALNDTGGMTALSEYLGMAKDLGIPFYLVNIVCEKEEHLTRFVRRWPQGGGRATLSRFWDKNLINEASIRARVNIETLSSMVFMRGRLDTTGREARDSAMEILRWMNGGASAVTPLDGPMVVLGSN